MTRLAISPPTITMANGTLRVGANRMRDAAGNKTKRGHKHGHHDGTQTLNRALDRGFDDVLFAESFRSPCAARATD